MTTNKNMNPINWLIKHLQADGGDPVRNMLQQFAEMLMSAEADATCGAEYGERSDGRTNQRNGYRQRGWDTRAGTIDLAIPRLRKGTYFPHWLLEPRRRSEKALWAAIATAYVCGVSTRRVDKLVKALGIDGISKSQVSRIVGELDEDVAAFRDRPLPAACPYLWLDALCIKVREGRRVVSVAAVLAIAVREDGHREVLGLDVITTEDGAGWTAFVRGLSARGLGGVKLVISDAHAGLRDAITATFAGASWQRCRSHFMRNLLTRVPKRSQSFVASAVRTIYAQPDAAAVDAQFEAVVTTLQKHYPAAAELLEEAKEDVLAFRHFPKQHWRQIWSNNPLERLNKEIRRRSNVVGIFPNRAALIRLVGALLAEQNDQWEEGRRYMSQESMKLIGTIAPGSADPAALPHAPNMALEEAA